ncbi:hypothetical protein N6H14_23150 [Paenibacillus sp. CC-CFT747]|nr:hypothetical protein N6H14_23150 [Paenibacillus sp. CC-CFT747]
MLKKNAAVLTLLVTGSLLAGCTDGKQLKQDAQNALTKQAQVNYYTFSGDADLDIGTPPPAKDANPTTSLLVSLFSKSKLVWSGAVSANPARMEALLKATPSGSKTDYGLPMIMKDNRLYLGIPGLNKTDEYYSFDLSKSSSASGFPKLSPAVSDAAKLLLADLDTKWFKKDKAPMDFKDGKKGTVIQMEITEKNRQDVSAKLQAKLPEMIDVLAKNSLLTADQADKLKKDMAAHPPELKAPGLISLATDDTGFIRDEVIRLDYTSKGSDGAAADHHIHLHQSFDNINGEAKFEKDVPKDAKPIEDLLKTLNQAPAKK